MKGLWSMVVAALLLAGAGCSTERHDMAHGGTSGGARPVLYDSLGS